MVQFISPCSASCAGQPVASVPKAKAKNKAKAKAKSMPGGVTEATAKTIDERKAEMSLALSITILSFNCQPTKYGVLKLVESNFSGP